METENKNEQNQTPGPEDHPVIPSDPQVETPQKPKQAEKGQKKAKRPKEDQEPAGPPNPDEDKILAHFRKTKAGIGSKRFQAVRVARSDKLAVVGVLSWYEFYKEYPPQAAKTRASVLNKRYFNE